MAGAPRVVIVAGEASGDMHGARLVRDLKGLLPGVGFSGIGGPAMAEAGVELVRRSEELALVGIAEVLPKLPVILGALGDMKRHLRETRPDLVVLIDFPDFNFRVGKMAKRLGLKVLYYVCPQVWAWRTGRARSMARFVDHLACVFPFEPDFLRPLAPELKASFVGHPLLDEPPEEKDPTPLAVPEGKKLVGLLPGSRMSEIKRLMPLLLAGARLMAQARDDLHFVLPLAPGLSPAEVEPYLNEAPEGLRVLPGAAAKVMRRARVLLVASGTATMEAALAGAPMVVVYKTGAFNYLMARFLIKVDQVAMPNLIAGRRVVPELLQHEATPDKVSRAGLALIDEGRERGEMLAGLAEVRRRLGGPGAGENVARLAAGLIEGKA